MSNEEKRLLDQTERDLRRLSAELNTFKNTARRRSLSGLTEAQKRNLRRIDQQMEILRVQLETIKFRKQVEEEERQRLLGTRYLDELYYKTPNDDFTGFDENIETPPRRRSSSPSERGVKTKVALYENRTTGNIPIGRRYNTPPRFRKPSSPKRRPSNVHELTFDQRRRLFETGNYSPPKRPQ